MKKLDAKYWSPFWRNPTITSFGHLFPDNYDGAMLEFWQRQITADVRELLDLACGNGALTWIASDITAALGADTNITGIDIAAIDPFTALGRDPAGFPRVRFVGSTRIEALPLPDGAADLAISQYGIEYAEPEAAIPEVGRVLGAGGRMAFIMHDRESVIVKGAIQHLDDFRRVRDEIRLHELCMAFDEMLRSDRNFRRLAQTDAFRKLEARIAEASYFLRLMLRAHPATSPVARYAGSLGQVLQMRSGKDAANRRRLIELAIGQLQAHIERVEDLWLAALSQAGRERFVALVEQQGFVVTDLDVLRYKDGDNFGTMFAARRR